MIDSIRRLLPKGFRNVLKNATKLSYLIAPLYGYLMLPRFNNTALIFGEGTKFFVHPDISAIDCLREILKENIYEKYKSIENGDVIIDVGANVGIFTVKARKEAGDSGLVCSIEPSSQNIELLKKNIALHNLLSRVKIVPKAVGSSQGKSKFLITPISGQHGFGNDGNLGEKQKVKEIEVDVDTLDIILQELNVQKIDLLKIDVEGAELEVLRGAEETLKITRNVAMELHYEGEEEEVKRFLKEKGFVVNVWGNMFYAQNTLIHSDDYHPPLINKRRIKE